MILAAAGLIAGRLIMLAGALAGTCYRLFFFLLAAAGIRLAAAGIRLAAAGIRLSAAGSRLAVGFGMCLSAGAGTITGNGFLFGAGACYRLAAAGSRLAVGFGMCLSAGAGTITGNRFLFGAGACYRLAAGHLLTTACFRLNMIFSA